ncbi:MAG: class I tRNA ligase family protein, partial [Parcubacteria group bacterium]|nr:class I tRNA ligase family protein [Parcubacteria group bacterium]
DTAMLKEVLIRRFRHTEWHAPDLVIIDGGKGQLNAAGGVISNSQFLISNQVPSSKFQVPRLKSIRDLERSVHKTIKKVTEDIEGLQYNTAISALMILLNEFEAKPDRVSADDLEPFLKLLAPFAPHITEELWQETRTHADGNADSRGDKTGAGRRGGFRSVHKEPWPKYNPRFIKEESADFVVQINGKTRGVVRLSAGSSQDDVELEAKTNQEIAKYLVGPIKRIIFVKDKLINFVVA